MSTDSYFTNVQKNLTLPSVDSIHIQCVAELIFQAVREGKVHIKGQFSCINVESEIESVGGKQDMRKKENKRFIDMTITLSAQIITNIDAGLAASSKWLVYTYEDSKYLWMRHELWWGVIARLWVAAVTVPKKPGILGSLRQSLAGHC